MTDEIYLVEFLEKCECYTFRKYDYHSFTCDFCKKLTEKISLPRRVVNWLITTLRLKR